MDKANWDAYHTRVFCEICKEETEKNNRPLGCLNAKGYKHLEEKFFEATKARLTKKQFKNKWDMLKKEYTQFMELKLAATGLGWDEQRGTIEADDNWWGVHLKNYPKHAKWRHMVPPNLKEMEIMFETIHVTGETTSIPGEISSSSDDNDGGGMEVKESDEIEELNPPSSSKKKKKEDDFNGQRRVGPLRLNVDGRLRQSNGGRTSGVSSYLGPVEADVAFPRRKQPGVALLEAATALPNGQRWQGSVGLFLVAACRGVALRGASAYGSGGGAPSRQRTARSSPRRGENLPRCATVRA